jgi:hypothetical protein
MAAVVLATNARFNGQRLAQVLHRHLPPYALPLFVRVMAAQRTTDTFKIQKGVLQQQGFDLAASSDHVYILREQGKGKGKGYVALGATLYRRILTGSLLL